jgi:hypothetical protein
MMYVILKQLIIILLVKKCPAFVEFKGSLLTDNKCLKNHNKNILSIKSSWETSIVSHQGSILCYVSFREL